MINIKNLSLTINNKTILNSISCNLLPGKITTFIGKSGAGKTTIFKSLVGLLKNFDGSILIDNQELSNFNAKQRSEKIGYVFQDFNLFPHLSILQNCSTPLKIHGMSHDKADQKALKVLQSLDMQDFANTYPQQLSGGQKQRTAIARALCLQPKVLLLDEPTASLDPFNTQILINILKQLATSNLIIGISSQDMNFVSKIFDEIYLVQDGKIVEFCDKKDKLNTCPLISKFIQSAKNNNV